MDYQDFRLDSFLRVSKELPYPGTNENITIRTLSDIEMSDKQEYITARRARMVAQLRDPQSAEYASKVSPLDAMTRQELVDRLLQSRQNDAVTEARNENPTIFLPLPDDPTEQEIVENRLKQKAVDDEVIAKRQKYVMDALASHEKTLADKSDDELLRIAKSQAVFLFSAWDGIKADQEYTIYRSVEVNGKPKWASPEEVTKLPEKVINRLLAEYRLVDAVDPWELTKSLSEKPTDGVVAEHGDQSPVSASP